MTLELPPNFDDYAWEVEAKGWLQGAVAVIDGRRYPLVFYDPTRLAQTIEDDLRTHGVFFELNLIVVPAVTRAHMEAAITHLASVRGHLDMQAEDEQPGERS